MIIYEQQLALTEHILHAKADAILTSTLQIRNLWHRQVGELAQGPPANKWQRQDPSSGGWTRVPIFNYYYYTRCLHYAEKKNWRLKKYITNNGTRKKPLKENCSYYFNWTVVFYSTDPSPGNTTNGGSLSWLVQAPFAKDGKPQLSKLCFSPVF